MMTSETSDAAVVVSALMVSLVMFVLLLCTEPSSTSPLFLRLSHSLALFLNREGSPFELNDPHIPYTHITWLLILFSSDIGRHFKKCTSLPPSLPPSLPKGLCYLFVLR